MWLTHCDLVAIQTNQHFAGASRKLFWIKHDEQLKGLVSQPLVLTNTPFLRTQTKELYDRLKLNAQGSSLPHFVFKLISPSARRARHNSLKDENGFFKAFHGTSFENLHSIVHNGLVNNLNKVIWMCILKRIFFAGQCPSNASPVRITLKRKRVNKVFLSFTCTAGRLRIRHLPLQNPERVPQFQVCATLSDNADSFFGPDFLLLVYLV